MIINEIEKLERGKYRITIDSGVEFYLYYREMKGLGIEIGSTLSDQQWEQIIELLVVRGKKRVYHLLARQDYTVYKITDKLKRDGYPEQVIRTVVDYFLSKGFVDDYAYIQKYYESYKKSKGRRVIESKLMEKGVDSSLIKSFFNQLDEPEVELTTALHLLEKKFGRMAYDTIEYNKMVRFLAYRGFGYELCAKAIEQFKANKLQ